MHDLLTGTVCVFELLGDSKIMYDAHEQIVHRLRFTTAFIFQMNLQTRLTGYFQASEKLPEALMEIVYSAQDFLSIVSPRPRD